MVVRDVVMLCLGSKLRKVEVFPLGTRPVRGKDAGVCARWLSIKLNGQGEDSDKGVGVEEALHAQGASGQCCLWEVLLFHKGKEGAVEVTVGQEDRRVLARVWTKGEDTGNGGQSGGKDVVVACMGALLDACSINEDQVGHDKVFGVGDQVDKDGGVIGEGVVGDL